MVNKHPMLRLLIISDFTEAFPFKRIILVSFIVLASAALAGAQQPDYLQQLEAHPEFLAGTDYLCPTGPVALTPAPKGYKAFYVSHYGRHGARYAWQSDMYSWLNEVFSSAEAAGNLTDLGRDYKRRFDSLYPSVRYRTGDLSRKGWQQQQELAERMYANNPEIFKGEATVRSWVSTSTRCVMTMSSFCLGLKGKNPKLDIFENFGYSFLPAILPLDGHNPFRVKDVPMTPLKFDETWEQYIARTIDYKAILARLFKEPGKAVADEKAWDLVSYLYFFAAGMNSLDTDLDFNDIFTPEERTALWKIDGFQFYAYAWPTHEGYMPIVSDIIEKADNIYSKADQIDVLVSDLFDSTLDVLGEFKVNCSDKESTILSEIIKKNDSKGLVTETELPKIIINIDDKRMSQVIGNIISNSYKYAGTRIDVDYGITDKYLKMVIKDYGPGVSRDELELITNKFYRGKKAESANKEGSGLGLYIAKSLMIKMNGELICDSDTEGFLVTLMIPIS